MTISDKQYVENCRKEGITEADKACLQASPAMICHFVTSESGISSSSSMTGRCGSHLPRKTGRRLFLLWNLPSASPWLADLQESIEAFLSTQRSGSACHAAALNTVGQAHPALPRGR